MFFDDYGFFGGGGFDDGVDRRNWRDKSDAAIRRENQAKGLFDAFLQKCSTEPTSFPITKEVVPPQVHLTDACWKSFRQYVLGKGCTPKRREATRQERIDSKDTRRGKLYVISVTVPYHPSKAIQAMKDKKQKAEQAALRKQEKAKVAAEQARKEAEQKARKEQQLQAKMEEEYKAIVAAVTLAMDKEDDKDKKTATNIVLTDHERSVNKEEDAAARPAKKAKLTLCTPKVTTTVPRDRMLAYALQMHSQQLNDFCEKLDHEKSTEREKLLSELESKYTAKRNAMKETQEEYYQNYVRTIHENCAASKKNNGNSLTNYFS